MNWIGLVRVEASWSGLERKKKRERSGGRAPSFEADGRNGARHRRWDRCEKERKKAPNESWRSGCTLLVVAMLMVVDSDTGLQGVRTWKGNRNKEMRGRERETDGYSAGKSSTDEEEEEEGEEDGPRQGVELVVLSQRGGCSRAAGIEGTSRRSRRAREGGWSGYQRDENGDEEGQEVRQPKERSGWKKKQRQKKEKRRGRPGG
ncbi:uncharacterized protein LOC143216426 [Lasioglossum baleicum]|uniref:uncharacterized protein LOC143216426 n=1 Tax=Lasioglossum baleicum TaxID=434251 RepID=UPI003FCCA605